MSIETWSKVKMLNQWCMVSRIVEVNIDWLDFNCITSVVSNYESVENVFKTLNPVFRIVGKKKIKVKELAQMEQIIDSE